MTDVGPSPTSPAPDPDTPGGGGAPVPADDRAREPPGDDADPGSPEELRAALTRAEARFYNTVERIADGVVVLGDADEIRYANPAARELFGRPPGELTGSLFGYPVTAGDVAEIDIVKADGTTSVAELRVVRTEWEGEDARLVSLRDVTDQRQAEERERELIREQAARAQAEEAARRSEILARAGEVLGSTLDLDDLLRALSGAITEELGDICFVDIDDRHGPMRRLVGARRDFPHRALLKDMEERLVHPAKDSLEGRVFRTGESELVPEVTEEWLDDAAADADEIHLFRELAPSSLMMVTLYAGPLRWGVVTVLSCDPSTRFDAADLALLEELVRRGAIAVENARLFRLAEEASRAKSDFLAIVSHELRTPLSAIQGYAGLLEEGVGGSLNEAQQEYVASINRSAGHLLRLIEQIITFARLEGDHEELEMEDVELARLLEEVVSLTGSMAEKRGLDVHCAVTGSTDGGPVYTDGKKVAQILINLVTNAVKFTDEGEVRLEAEVLDDEVLFRVMDTGCGIPEDKLEEIFEPFRQAERPQTRKNDGTGIGLSVVKRLTHLLGGEVRVESEVGRGSTFMVRLPRKPREEDASSG